MGHVAPARLPSSARKPTKRTIRSRKDVEPGTPWENACIGTFKGKLRDELLDREMFTCLAEAKHLSAHYRFEYNHERPHSSLGYRTPAEFASGCSPSGSATLRLRANTRRSLQPVALP